MQCGLLRFLFRLVVYRVGTEAGGIFLEFFKLHSEGFSLTEMIRKRLGPGLHEMCFH